MLRVTPSDGVSDGCHLATSRAEALTRQALTLSGRAAETNSFVSVHSYPHGSCSPEGRVTDIIKHKHENTSDSSLPCCQLLDLKSLSDSESMTFGSIGMSDTVMGGGGGQEAVSAKPVYQGDGSLGTQRAARPRRSLCYIQDSFQGDAVTRARHPSNGIGSAGARRLT